MHGPDNMDEYVAGDKEIIKLYTGNDGKSFVVIWFRIISKRQVNHGHLLAERLTRKTCIPIIRTQLFCYNRVYKYISIFIYDRRFAFFFI